MPPLVSVIIPFRDRIDWTVEAVQSVLQQTFQDFEIVLVDDGSEGDCRDLLEKQDGRIKYVRQPNRGPAAARNAGIRHAGGEFVAFLDSDDLFEPRKLETQVSIFRDNPGALFSHTSYKRIDSSGKEIEDVASGQFSGDVYPGIWGSCPIATPTVMVRRSIFAELAFNEDVRLGEDIILWAQVAKLAGIIGIDRPLTRVRLHSMNASVDMQKQLEGTRNVMLWGISRDAELSAVARRKVKSALYRNLLYLHSRSGQSGKAARYWLLAFLCWPFDLELYIDIARTVLPRPLRRALRPLYRRLAGK